MDSYPARIARSLVAGILGAVGWLLLFSVVLVLGLVVTQAALLWRESGTFALFPTQTNTSNRAAVVISGATDAQAAAIRTAVVGLAYRLPLRAVTFNVTTDPCDNCGGEYLAGLNVIRIRSDLADQGGPSLQHTIAHEAGHYVDEQYLNNSLRARFMRLRGIPANLSWYSANKPWEDRPSEDFAEVFAMLTVATAVGPVRTSYGPVRHRADYVSLLDAAGIDLVRPTSPPDWQLVLAREIAFARYLAEDWRMRVCFWIVVAFYAAAGAIHSARQSWQR